MLIFSIDLVNIFNVLNPLQVHHSMPFKFGNFFISIFSSVTNPRVQLHQLFLLRLLLADWVLLNVLLTKPNFVQTS